MSETAVAECVRQLSGGSKFFAICLRCQEHWRAEVPIDECPTCNQTDRLDHDAESERRYYAELVQRAVGQALQAAEKQAEDEAAKTEKALAYSRLLADSLTAERAKIEELGQAVDWQAKRADGQEQLNKELMLQLEAYVAHSCACDWTSPSTQPRTTPPDVECAYHAAVSGSLEATRAALETCHDELTGEEKSRDMHADLNRRAALALGKPFEGENSSWHDIPEQITALRAKLEKLREAVAAACAFGEQYVKADLRKALEESQ